MYVQGLGLLTIRVAENQVEKTVENEIEARFKVQDL